MNTTKSYLKHRLVALLKCWMLAFALLTTTSMNLFSQEATSGEATSIKTKDIENKSVREIFSILETRYALKIAFQEGDSTFYQPVALPDAKTISLPDLLKVLEKNIPYNVIHKNGYIIFQKKNLQKKYILKGNVKDANSDQKLVTASVYIKQSGQGLLTDDNGAYTFELKPGSYDVVVKFMGYNDKVIHINLYDDQTLNTKLEENYYSISEVDITATRTIANNFEVGRTIERLDSKEIGSVTTGNVMDALHARIPGVWATKISGAPGDHMKIRIRGINSINGSVDPLYIVDGVPIPKVNFNSLGISDLNSSDIESMTVLKDAASSAIYGFQGGNGVVIIKTKSPGGKPTFTVQQKTGVQMFKTKRYNTSGTYDFLQTFNLADANLRTQYYTNYRSQHPYYTFSLDDKNWQEEIFRTGVMTEYEFSAKGGAKGLNYYASVAHLNHDGIIKNSNYIKNNVLINLCYTINTKGSIGINYRGATEDNNNNLDTYYGNPLIFQGINTAPYAGSEPKTGLTYRPIDKLLYPQEGIIHKGGAEDLINNFKQIQTINSNSAIINGNYELIKNLHLNASVSYSRKDYKYKYEEIDNTGNELNQLTGLSGYLQSTEQVNFINYNAELSYKININNHELKLFGGYRDYMDNVYWLIDSTSYDTRILETMPQIYPRGSMIIYNDRGSMTRTLRSGYYHANYNYNQKYTLSFAGNYSALYEMDKHVVSAFFPSTAVNWDVSKEKWLSGVEKLNALNLYVNWGQVGNFPLNGLANDLYSTRSFSDASSTTTQTYLNNLGNHSLTHEILTETNLGAKITILNHRLSVGADYYTKVNSDLMLIREVPSYYGGGKMMINAGEMHSSGIELSFEATPIKTKNFSWYMRGDYSSNNQYVSKLDSSLYFYNELDYIPDFIVAENQPLGSIMGYEFVALYDATNENQKQLIEEGKVYQERGALYTRYDQSTNEERQIGSKSTPAVTEKDRVPIGKSIPDFTFNFMNSFQYKNFQLDMYWYGVIGVDKYNATKASTYMSAVNVDVYNAMQDGYNKGADYYRTSTFYN